MNKFIENLLISLKELEISSFDKDDVLRYISEKCNNCRFSNLGFDIVNDEIADVKIYFAEMLSKGDVYSEKSFSIVKKDLNFELRKVTRHVPAKNDDGIEEIIKVFKNNGFPYNSEEKFIRYGKIIQSYTRTGVFPYFGGGISLDKNNTVKGAKLYYTFFSYKNVKEQFGSNNSENSIKCVNKLVDEINVNIAVKNNLLKIFNTFENNIIFSLFAVNFEITGDEEYKIYFLLSDETLSDRKINLMKILRILDIVNVDDKIDKIISTLEQTKGYKFNPLEICLAVKENKITVKSYFRVVNKIS